MIINIINSETNRFLKNTKRFLRNLYIEFRQRKVFRILNEDVSKLQTFFQTNYPKLKVDNLSNTFCVSCDLCQNVCPTNAITIEKANMINFPKTLTTGEAPMHFYLDVLKCIKCGECKDVCLVDALEMTGKYNGKKIDLTILDSN